MGPHYKCSTCGRCYVRDHVSFFQDGRWFWRGPCGVKYAFPERPDLPANGQVMVEATFKVFPPQHISDHVPY